MPYEIVKPPSNDWLYPPYRISTDAIHRPLPREGCGGGQGGGDGGEETRRGDRGHDIAVTRFRLSGQNLSPQVAHGCQLLDCRVDDSVERRLRRPAMLTGLWGRRRHVGLVPDLRSGRLLAVGGGLTHAGLLQQVGPGLLERPVQADGDPGPERQGRPFLDGGG